MTKSPDAPVIGVDLGATNSQYGVVGPDDTVVTRHHAPTQADLGPDGVAKRIVEQVLETCRQSGLDAGHDLGAVGVAVAGAVDIKAGVVLDADNMGWKNYPLREVLERDLPCPVVVDNDVNGAVWGEYRAGAARGAGDVFGIWVGTGVGGGLVLDGRLHHGELSTAGEIGHTISVPDGPRDERTVEDLCSRSGMKLILKRRLPARPTSMIHELTDRGRKPIDTDVIAQGWKRGDELVTSVVERGARLLGVGIANVVTLLALDTVVVGGGITEALGEPYLDLVRASFADEVFPDRGRECRILMTELKADAGLLGAGLLAREGVEGPRVPRPA